MVVTAVICGHSEILLPEALFHIFRIFSLSFQTLRTSPLSSTEMAVETMLSWKALSTRHNTLLRSCLGCLHSLQLLCDAQSLMLWHCVVVHMSCSVCHTPLHTTICSSYMHTVLRGMKVLKNRENWKRNCLFVFFFQSREKPSNFPKDIFWPRYSHM